MKKRTSTPGRWLAGLAAALMAGDQAANAQPSTTQNSGNLAIQQAEANEPPALLRVNTLPDGRSNSPFVPYWDDFPARWLAKSAALQKRDSAGLAELSVLLARESHRPVVPLLRAEVEAARLGVQLAPCDSQTLIDVINRSEQDLALDPWTLAWVWRHTHRLASNENATARREVFTRLQRHARLIDTITRARAAAGLPNEANRPWMSKAAPPPLPGGEELRKKRIQRASEEAVRLYPTSDGGSWDRESRVSLKLSADSGIANLLHRAQRSVLATGAAFDLGRLDLLETGEAVVKLEHEQLGSITLPPNTFVSIWDWPRYLNANARMILGQSVNSALLGDEAAAENVRRVLPFAHTEIRKAIIAKPDAKGAPMLRMLLMLFDDMPTWAAGNIQ